MAYVISDECVSCGACEAECPVGAISVKDTLARIDPKTCIACGKCVKLGRRQKVGECGCGCKFITPSRVNHLLPTSFLDLFETLFAFAFGLDSVFGSTFSSVFFCSGST